MIEVENLVERKNVAPWHDFRQIEMDLIISKAMISMFKDPFLCRELRMRGGTALNKLHFPYPIRYSEDIDLVRTELGPIGPSIDHLRAALGLVVFDGLVVDQIIESFLFYLQQSGKTISRAEAETRMFAKLAGGRLLDDILPILSSSYSINYTDKRLKNDFATVFSKLITQIPGKPWKRTEEKIEKFGIELH